MEVGGWVQVSLGFFLLENRPKNSPKPVHIFWSSVFCLYIAKSCWLLLFECSVHVSDGFPKKKLSGRGERYPFFLGIFGVFLTLQSPFTAHKIQVSNLNRIRNVLIRSLQQVYTK